MARIDTAQLDYDVIIAGGGVAGICAAAALREFNWSVLIVEPGQRSERRLGGELIHPFGVAALNELGLLNGHGLYDGALINGFTVFPHPDVHAAPIFLPYAEGQGLALDHARIRFALTAAGRALPYVTMAAGRIVGIDEGEPTISVTVRDDSGERCFRCRMLIAADGASSAVRRFAGIPHERRPTSAITGYIIPSSCLPAPQTGHLFIGAMAPILAYEIGGGEARILFDQPLGQLDTPALSYRTQLAASIADDEMRIHVGEALRQKSGLGFVCADVLVSVATKGRVVLVGDAGGSCHPLTATGMNVGMADALRLRDSLVEARGDIPAGLALYAQRRRAPQRTRLLVASTLHQACSGTSIELKVIRAGLIRYWTSGARERRASMAILAMKDMRTRSVLRELMLVVLYGLASLWREKPVRGVSSFVRIGAGMAGIIIRQMTFAMRAR